jgi:hypothetical protein
MSPDHAHAGSAANGWMPSWMLMLPPGDLAAIPLLLQFEHAHPGVKIVIPHHPDEPWRVVIDASTVPGDARIMAGGHPMPGPLLDELQALFSREHSPP